MSKRLHTFMAYWYLGLESSYSDRRFCRRFMIINLLSHSHCLIQYNLLGFFFFYFSINSGHWYWTLKVLCYQYSTFLPWHWCPLWFHDAETLRKWHWSGHDGSIWYFSAYRSHKSLRWPISLHARPSWCNVNFWTIKIPDKPLVIWCVASVGQVNKSCEFHSIFPFGALWMGAKLLRMMANFKIFTPKCASNRLGA